MKNRLYTINDRLSDRNGPIFEAANDHVAKRQFKGILENNPNMDSLDFTLVCLGEYDYDTPCIVPLSQCQTVSFGDSLMEEESE